MSEVKNTTRDHDLLAELKDIMEELEINAKAEAELPPHQWIQLEKTIIAVLPGLKKCADFWRGVESRKGCN